MTRKTFTAKLERFPGTGTWVYASLPFDAVKVFGAKGQLKVKGTLDGAQFRSSLMPHGDGRHFIVVNKAMRAAAFHAAGEPLLRFSLASEAGAAAKAEVGDTVTLMLEPDAAPRIVTAPKDLQKALNANKAAKAAFGKLPYSHQKEYVEWIESAKKAETRLRRVASAVDKIAGGKKLKG
ncbi:MAG: DUF1905 domain-containing protein [Anaerolineales bacterium]